MSVKKVTTLRRSGELQEAYNLAYSELQENCNEWTQMSMFWVLRDLCKEDISKGDTAKARERLSAMADLLPEMMDNDGIGEKAYDFLLKQLNPNANTISDLSNLSKTQATEAYQKAVAQFGKEAERLGNNLHEDFAWILYRYLKENSAQLTSDQASSLLSNYMNLKNDRPSLVHSMILNFALGFAKGHSDFNFYPFLKKWNTDNLRYEDFQDSDKEGHVIPSLVSRILRFFAETDQKVNWTELFRLLEIHPHCMSHDELIDCVRQAKFWQLMHLHDEGKWDELWSSFSRYAKEFSASGPSHWHSEILKIANRFMEGDQAIRFLPFIQNWNIDNLRPEDWKNEVGQDGKEYRSLATKCAKKCFDTLKAIPQKQSITTQQMDWMKTFYKKIMEHDKDEWSIRNYATLCIWKQEYDEAIKIYKRLMTDLSDRFFVWSELASCIQNNNRLKTGLLLKAKRAEKNEDYIGDIHLDLSELWIGEGFHNAASKELQLYIDNRMKNKWPVSERFREMTAMIDATRKESTVRPDYQAYIEEAESFALDQYDEFDFVFTGKGKHDDKEICYFTNGEGLTFFVKPKRFKVCATANVGDVIRFRCQIEEKQKGKVVTPLLASKTDLEPWSLLPIKYGVIDYDNYDRNVLHILTQDSILAFYRYNKTSLKKGDFVRFRSYEGKKEGETVTRIVHLSPCSKDEAITRFPYHVFVVDNVNEVKQLFHITADKGKIENVIHYNDTTIRPSVGDSLGISYCIKMDKHGNERFMPLQINTVEP